jgi:hypothetical protein
MNSEHPNLVWLKKHKLSTDYKPVALIKVLSLLERKLGDPKKIVVLDDWNESTIQEQCPFYIVR